MKAIRLLLLLSLFLLLSAVLLGQVGLERLAPILLTRMGLAQVSLELSQVDHQHIGLRTLAFVLPNPAGPIAVRISDAVCRYQVPELLHGRISSCSAGELDISLPEWRTSPKAADTDLPRLEKLLNAIDPGQIPVQQLELRQLGVHYAGADPEKPVLFSLNFLNALEQQRLLFRSTKSTNSPALRVELLKKNNELSGNLHLDLAGVRNLLPPAVGAGLPTHGTLTGQLKYTPSQPLRIQLDLSGLQSPAISIGRVSVLLASDKPVAVQELQFSSASQLTISNLETGNTRLRSFSLNLAGALHLAADRWQWQLASGSPCTVEGLVTGDLHFAPLRLDDLHLRTLLKAEQMQLDANLSTPLGKGTITVHCGLQRDQSGTGECRVASDKALILDSEHNPLNLLLDKPPLEIQQGKLAFSLEHRWHAQTPPQMQVDIDASVQQGALLDMPLTGLSLRQRLQILPQLQTTGKGQLALVRLLGPVPLQQLTVSTWIRTDKRSKKPVLNLEQGRVDLLDGRIALQQCAYALDGSPSTCLLSLAAIDLEPLIALHQVEGLEVTGRIQGQLPLHFSSKGLRVEHGTLENEAPGGIIRYRPPAATLQDSPLAGYALAALRDLYYRQLAAQVDYQPDGTLTVALQIKGHNPGLDNGRPVHLNLNTEQNLLSLLKSVQYSQSLSSELGRKLMHSPSP